MNDVLLYTNCLDTTYIPEPDIVKLVSMLRKEMPNQRH